MSIKSILPFSIIVLSAPTPLYIPRKKEPVKTKRILFTLSTICIKFRPKLLIMNSHTILLNFEHKIYLFFVTFQFSSFCISRDQRLSSRVVLLFQRLHVARLLKLLPSFVIALEAIRIHIFWNGQSNKTRACVSLSRCVVFWQFFK